MNSNSFDSQPRDFFINPTQAATVSTIDVFLRRDLWHQKIKKPCKMGCDLVGRVVNVGDRCDDIKLGDRVCAVGLGIGGDRKSVV